MPDRQSESIDAVVSAFLEGEKVLYLVSEEDRKKQTREIREEVLVRKGWVVQTTLNEFSLHNGGSLKVVCLTDEEDWTSTPADTLLYVSPRPFLSNPESPPSTPDLGGSNA